MILYKKQLFDLEVKGQGPTKVIMVYTESVYTFFGPTFVFGIDRCVVYAG
jgi:hypothetical protein